MRKTFYGLVLVLAHGLIALPADASNVSISPKSIRFSSQGTDTTSLTKAVQVKNTSDAPLSIVLLRREGPDREDFSQSNNCGAPLDPKQSCLVSIQFSPSSSGDKVARLDIETTSGVISVPLSGKAVGPRISASPKALRFSKQSVATRSTPKNIVLKNSAKGELRIESLILLGDHAKDFTTNHDCVMPLPYRQSCRLSVDFSPQGSGQRSGVVRITSNAGPFDIALSGVGYQAEPKLALKSRRISFSTQGTGTTSDPKILVVSNRGAAPLRITDISRSGSDATSFNYADNCRSEIAPGGTCEIQIRFSPNGVRNHEAVLQLDSNAGQATVPLLGKAAGPRPKLSPTRLSFENTATFRTSGAKALTLRNTGKGVLMPPVMVLTEGHTNDFVAETDCPSFLVPGESCLIQVAFAPRSSGEKASTLEIRFPNVEAPLRVSLRGIAEKSQNDISVSGLPAVLDSYQPVSINVSGLPSECRISVESVGTEQIHHMRRDPEGRFTFRAPIVLFPAELNLKVFSDVSADCASEKLYRLPVRPPASNKVPFLKFSPHTQGVRDALTTDHYSVFEFGMAYTFVAEKYSATFCYPTPDDCSTTNQGIPGYLPAGMQAGDFNGDGHQDVVIAVDIGAREYEAQSDENYSSKVLVLLNDGTGRLIEDTEFYDKDKVTELQNPYRIAIADFNGDGVDDIFVGNFGNWGISENNTSFVGPAVQGLFLSSPQGLIDASDRIAYQIPNTGFLRPVHDAAVADFDGDGDIDITISGYILFNDGKGSFPAYLDLLTLGQNSPDASAAGDFNGDGIGDVVLFFRHSNGVGGNGTQVGPDGCYTGQIPPQVEPYCSGHIAFGPFSPQSGQRTNDGRTFTRIGAGIFGTNTHFNHAAVGDLDQDGDLDIVVGSTRIDRYYEGRKVQVLLNDGQGRFSDATNTHYSRQPIGERQSFATGGNVGIGEGDILLKDFDGDGDLDIIDSHGDCGCSDISDYPRVIVALNDGRGFFEPISNDIFPRRMELGFFEGYDGISDGMGRVSGEPGFLPNGRAHPDEVITKKILRSAFVDLDGEGDLDLVSYFWEYHYRTIGNRDPQEKNFYTIFSVINTKEISQQ